MKPERKVKRHRCQWCGEKLAERYMRLWNGRWQCRAVWACQQRAQKGRGR